MSVIHFENVSKRYRLGEGGYRTFSEDLASLFSRRVASGGSGKNTVWALKDVSFEVDHHQTLGLIGPNGAGKTTTLRLLAGITQPTSGKISAVGRMGVLIELTAGFHPELTGRENIYLNGSILGMKKREIDREFDDIVDFSGIKEFLDTPLKRYSSGMLVRLGFSVAVHVNPEILLVDEVLAVGDYAFQARCYSKISQLKAGGVTTVFVSHQLDRVRRYCDRALLLDKGQVVRTGPAEEVCAYYVRSAQEQMDRGKSGQGVAADYDSGIFGPVVLNSPVVHNVRLELVDEMGNRIDQIRTGDNVAFRFSFDSLQEFDSMLFSIAFYREDGLYLVGYNSLVDGVRVEKTKGRVIGAMKIPRFTLYPGKYSLSFAIQDGPTLLYRDPRFQFKVQYERQHWGLFDLGHTWDIGVK